MTPLEYTPADDATAKITVSALTVKSASLRSRFGGRTEPRAPASGRTESLGEGTSQDYAKCYTSCYSRTVALLRSRGASQSDAVEFAQAAWAKGWESLHQLRDWSRIVPWINSIAFNLYRTSLLWSRRESALSETIPCGPEGWASWEVRLLLEKCRPEDSEILVSRYWSGLSIQEIGRQHNWSDGATRVRLLRARRSLKREIER